MNDSETSHSPAHPSSPAGSPPKQRAWLPADYLFAIAVLMIGGLWISTRLWPQPTAADHAADHAAGPAMPAKVQDAAERQLYLEPGGLYTAADIEANGGRTASEKFAGFRAQHDFNPQPGEAICPVTRTKANLTCDWIIGGKRYTFCCPPCIDEFLDLAKQQPEQVQPPEHYRAGS